MPDTNVLAPIYTEEALFTRLIKLYNDEAVGKEDQKAVKKDFTYDSDMNSKGLSKDAVKLIDKAAKLFVSMKFEEKEAEALEVFEKYKALTQYEG
ncbi:hypothetical protein [Pseudomonas sp.]|uniref:hypothetical protein n=1 Tax=Pseudomonas sp. TaxID=306 RepID=UPI003FD75C53